MHQPVMTVADEDKVAEVSRPTMRPVLDVMRRGPRRRAVASWPLASPVTRMKGASGRPGRQTAGTPDVDDG